ncbi:MAG: DNA-binding protein WhiA [Clostridia bacterium]|nr:DNA-binding protein WhiA [Clostridia bacterium]
MNFGESVKEEIMSKPIKEKHCKRAFLAGLIRGGGVLFENERGYGLSFKVAGEYRAMHATELIKSVFGFEVREMSVEEDRLNRRDVFEITVSGAEAEEMMSVLGIAEKNADGEIVVQKMFGAITEKDCCFRAFLRGLFVSAGSCTLPDADESQKTGYHLELSFSHAGSASAALEKLGEKGIKGRITRRKHDYVFYVKSAEEIKDFLAFLPAPVSVLKLTDVMIERELFNVSNRRKNCDLGNVNRQIEAQEKITRAIDYIERQRGLDYLKDDLRLTAAARRTYQDDTLSELAERLAVTKSCLNHRLRKIAEIAEELKKEK